jgi:hypothetical protein
MNVQEVDIFKYNFQFILYRKKMNKYYEINMGEKKAGEKTKCVVFLSSSSI